jgi:L-amino acid N-acyltransferase
VRVRPATPEDAAAILEIYNDAILQTTAVYSHEPVTLENRLEWLEGKARDGWPVFVADDERTVVGCSSYGPFRAWPAYLHTVENSVYVHPDHRGRGIGKLLIPPLFEAARAQDMHAFIAGIDAENRPSQRLHQHFGFEQVAHFREVGFKFGRWLNLTFWQVLLGGSRHRGSPSDFDAVAPVASGPVEHHVRRDATSSSVAPAVRRPRSG